METAKKTKAEKNQKAAERSRFFRRTVIPGPPVRVSYEMTASGKDLEPVIRALRHWAEQWVEIKSDRKRA